MYSEKQDIEFTIGPITGCSPMLAMLSLFLASPRSSQDTEDSNREFIESCDPFRTCRPHQNNDTTHSAPLSCSWCTITPSICMKHRYAPCSSQPNQFPYVVSSQPIEQNRGINNDLLPRLFPLPYKPYISSTLTTLSFHGFFSPL